MFPRLLVKLAIGGASVLTMSSAHAQSATTKRAREVVAVINAATPVTIRAFVDSAFDGQTPDEMYRGTGDDVPRELKSRRKAARAERLATNRSVSCGVCALGAAV